MLDDIFQDGLDDLNFASEKHFLESTDSENLIARASHSKEHVHDVDPLKCINFIVNLNLKIMSLSLHLYLCP